MLSETSTLNKERAVQRSKGATKPMPTRVRATAGVAIMVTLLRRGRSSEKITIRPRDVRKT